MAEEMKKDKGYYRNLIRGSMASVVIIVIVFASAGRWDYWQGWMYSLISMFFLILTLVIMLKMPDLINERISPGKGMKWWDKVYFAVTTPLSIGSIILAAVDAGRFGWTKEIPVFLYIIGYVSMVVGHIFFMWAKTTNRFFSSVVRIQTDRGHQVCKGGPYRIVRHPGYVGGILFGMATPVVLGSLWAVIPALLANILLVVRAYLEDKTLQKELPGYLEYTREVKYRLVPGVW